MPLGILLALVVGGIAGITLLLHITGKSRVHVLTPEAASTQWLRHFPDDAVIDVTVTHDGHAALVRTKAGPGLLWSFGADTVARYLLDCTQHAHPDGLAIRFRDFSAPYVILHLDETERRHWHNLMDPL